LIIDEGHFLKTIDSQRTRAIFGGGSERHFPPLVERCGSVLTLTGTPLPNRPREGYTLARAHNWDSIDFMSEDHFRERFNPSMKRERIDEDTGRKIIWIDERTGRHAELQNRMRATFMTRHLKREVLTQLKRPVYDLIQLEETGAIRAALAAERLLDINPEDLKGADAAVLGDIATVRRLMGIAMAPQAAEYIDTLLLSGEEKLVIFAWHHEVMDILENRLKPWGVLRWAAGANKANDRRKELFMMDPTYQIALGNVLTLGTGTDGLQHVSDHALIVEADWVPGNNIQCFDRLDRGGQKRTVRGDIFVVAGSFAEKILASALRKLQTTHKALDRRIA
jgi:SNF2 family DNA or RNA helicase